MTARHWCITSFQTPLLEQYDPELYAAHFDEFPNINYLIFQLEKAPTTDQVHLQGYIEYKKPVRMGTVKATFEDNTAHIEKRIGTREQCITYCKKEESRLENTEPFQYGICHQQQGQRNDLEAACTLLKRSLDIKDLVDEMPGLYIKYHRGFEKMVSVLKEKRTWKTMVFVVWGEPGSGKTRSAYEWNPDAYFLQRGNGKNLWFDGYYDQTCVIIDDFYNTIPYDTMLRLCDRYPCRVECKGGSTEFLAQKLIITTNLNPNDIYPNAGNNVDAFWRRVDRVIYYKDDIPYLSDRYGGINERVNADVIYSMGVLTPVTTPVE